MQSLSSPPLSPFSLCLSPLWHKALLSQYSLPFPLQIFTRLVSTDTLKQALAKIAWQD